MARPDPVEHFTNGKSAWTKDAYGLTRFRGIAAAPLSVMILSGIPWWWPNNFWSITISFEMIIPTIIIIISLFLLASLYYLRVRSRRSLDMKYGLHMIPHTLRNQYCEIKSKSQKTDIEAISDVLCEKIQRYFSILIPRTHIGVALRLANMEAGKKIYETVGRSCLDQHRKDTSQHLPSDVGIARVLQDDKGKKGTLVYNDLEAASKAGAFKKDDNYNEYPKDIKTMMVAPVNGWDGEKKSMLGILYVTSDEDNIFKEKHADTMGFVSDVIANFYSDYVTDRLGNNNGGQYELL